jgi:hypothetical protein
MNTLMTLMGARHNKVKLYIGIVPKGVPKIPRIDAWPGFDMVKNGTDKDYAPLHL